MASSVQKRCEEWVQPIIQHIQNDDLLRTQIQKQNGVSFPPGPLGDMIILDALDGRFRIKYGHQEVACLETPGMAFVMEHVLLIVAKVVRDFAGYPYADKLFDPVRRDIFKLSWMIKMEGFSELGKQLALMEHDYVEVAAAFGSGLATGQASEQQLPEPEVVELVSAPVQVGKKRRTRGPAPQGSVPPTTTAPAASPADLNIDSPKMANPSIAKAPASAKATPTKARASPRSKASRPFGQVMDAAAVLDGLKEQFDGEVKELAALQRNCENLRVGYDIIEAKVQAKREKLSTRPKLTETTTTLAGTSTS